MWLDIWQLQGFGKEKYLQLRVDLFIAFHTTQPSRPSQEVCTVDITLCNLNHRYVRLFMLHLPLPRTRAAQPSIETDFLPNCWSGWTPPFFANQGSVSLYATPDCEMNYNCRYTFVLICTIDQNGPYKFSQSGIAASSLLVWDAKSLSTTDLLGSHSWPLYASIF